MDNLSLKQKLNQMFILGTKGNGYKRLLVDGLGGIIFFTDDIIGVNQFRNLINEIKSDSLISPFLSIDQEGGRVERTQNIHKGKKYLSPRFAYEKGEEYLKKQTQNISEELLSYGINLNFAPCVDVNTNPDNPIIGERAFSSNPEDVIKGGKIVSQTYRNNGIIPCVKHFPGHGDANADSHLTLPEINLSLVDMEKTHIRPFKAAISENIEMIMVAHLHCTCFEEDKIPASLSKNAISYLRNSLGYDGVLISDDMIMKGVADFGQVQACLMGIKAGLNLFIYRDSEDSTLNIIDEVYKIAQKDKELRNCIEESYSKIIKLKRKYNLIES